MSAATLTFGPGSFMAGRRVFARGHRDKGADRRAGVSGSSLPAPGPATKTPSTTSAPAISHASRNGRTAGLLGLGARRRWIPTISCRTRCRRSFSASARSSRATTGAFQALSCDSRSSIASAIKYGGRSAGPTDELARRPGRRWTVADRRGHWRRDARALRGRSAAPGAGRPRGHHRPHRARSRRTSK